MISAVVLTKNEAEQIKTCLNSLKWCDEILVIDDFSEDKTREIAKSLGAKVLKRHLDDDFSSQRSFALTKTKYSWVLYVDADEKVTAKLRDEILKAIKDESLFGYYLERKDLFLGKPLEFGETKIKLLRLIKKGRGKWRRKVHEYWETDGEVGVLDSILLHDSHRSLTDFIRKINKYSDLHQKELKKEKKASIIKVVFWPLGKLVNNLIFKLGILDFTYGFVLAIFMSFHSFLAWSRLWLSENG